MFNTPFNFDAISTFFVKTIFTVVLQLFISSTAVTENETIITINLFYQFERVGKGFKAECVIGSLSNFHFLIQTHTIRFML